ncbi:MAG: UDP-N-acetylglucosamine 2-epimerase (non-hydrolyzing) [Woeseiaceae bacterium]|nr:UDP-N-acetylglucosamine 2-epimerase (non-hydrolyzing) [Woeseiaceae bacterium]
MKVLTVFGTRPEAIKMAPVIKALEAEPDKFVSKVCVTAQHREMLDQMMDVFQLSADYDLDLMREGQSPAQVAGTILSRLPDILNETKPDILLVQGDTMTTFAAGLSAYLARIPVGHIEAGLRTGNLDHPFPEEMNRRLTTQVAQLHFAPTDSARNALLSEGVSESDVFVTGNTVIDALLATIDSNHTFVSAELAALPEDREILLVTTHRRESFGKPLENICNAIATLAKRYSEYQVVLPVHPNPNVKSHVVKSLGDLENVTLCDPLEYRDFVNIMGRAKLILTDSGGAQEEAPSLNVPVLVLREVTERPEGVHSGASRLVGTDYDFIVANAIELLEDQEAYSRMAASANPYGDGTAAAKILKALGERLQPASLD